MLPPHHVLGHYRLVRRIGSGGMGEIFLAEDTRIARQVAIKVVRAEIDPYPDAAQAQETQRLFQREMRAITMLDHPHILPLHDYGEEQIGNTTITYMVMPFRPEGSLSDWLRRHKETQKQALTPQEVAHFIAQAADALQHAHDHQLIHQDVKPANFLIRERAGRPLPDLLLTDFGIAKITSATATSSQSVRGTPAYMAPEQWEGHPCPATDQYALAVMAYLLLTGVTPFSGRMEQVMHQHLMKQPAPPSHLNPALPPALDAVILRALTKQPEQRFPTINAFAQAFEQGAPARKGNVPERNSPQSLTTTIPDSLPHAPERQTPAHVVAHYQTFSPVSEVAPLPTTPLVLASSAANSPAPVRLSRVKFPLLLSLLVLLIVASVGAGVSIYENQLSHKNMAATATAQTYAVATAHVNATATTIMNTYATATATIQAYPSYLSGHGTLAFFDPLTQENRWKPDHDNNGGSCAFVNGSYHLSESQTQYIYTCRPYETFSNFAFEVQMTIIKGGCGGIVFRETLGVGHFYLFGICQDGSYYIQKYLDITGPNVKELNTNNFTSYMRKGLNMQNKIAVVANRSTLMIYVNEHQIDQIQDSDYPSGTIDLAALPDSGPTEVAYTNARVWTL